jgi:hypothetical protein
LLKIKEAEGEFINISLFLYLILLNRKNQMISCILHAHGFFSNHQEFKLEKVSLITNSIVELVKALLISSCWNMFGLLTNCPNSLGYINTWWILLIISKSQVLLTNLSICKLSNDISTTIA